MLKFNSQIKYSHLKLIILDCMGTFLQFLAKAFDKVPHRGSGTPQPKTISARDSSAQIEFFTGTPRPGTPRPSYKNILFVVLGRGVPEPTQEAIVQIRLLQD